MLDPSQKAARMLDRAIGESLCCASIRALSSAAAITSLNLEDTRVMPNVMEHSNNTSVKRSVDYTLVVQVEIKIAGKWDLVLGCLPETNEPERYICGSTLLLQLEEAWSWENCSNFLCSVTA